MILFEKAYGEYRDIRSVLKWSYLLFCSVYNLYSSLYSGAKRRPEDVWKKEGIIIDILTGTTSICPLL